MGGNCDVQEAKTKLLLEHQTWASTMGEYCIQPNQDSCDRYVIDNMVIRNTKKQNFQQARLEVQPIWDINKFRCELKDYHDKEMLQYLQYGWPINCHNIGKLTKIPPNHARVTGHKQALRRYLKQEVEHGSVIGPFIDNPFGDAARFSPLNTRPKPDSTEPRIIADMSFSHGNSVNDHIPKYMYLGKERRLKYPTIDALVKLIHRHDRGCFVFKRDLHKACRQMFVDLGNIHLLGYMFDGLYYFDTTLTMGMRSSADICQRCTDAVMFIYREIGYNGNNYLDDLGSAEAACRAWLAFQELGELLKQLGIWESLAKACPPPPPPQYNNGVSGHLGQYSRHDVESPGR